MTKTSDLFSTDWSTLPPHSDNGSRSSGTAAKLVERHRIPSPVQLLDKEEQQQDSVFPAPSALLSLRLPDSSAALGVGRHSSVHLASYRRRPCHRDDADQLEQIGVEQERETEDSTASSRQWKLCAAKRLAEDQDSQLAGLNEAIMLEKLSSCKHVVGLIGLKHGRREVVHPDQDLDPSSSSVQLHRYRKRSNTSDASAPSLRH